MKKTIFLAGASGAIGKRLSPILLNNGWQIFGTTRSSQKESLLRKMGIEPVVIDVFDAEKLTKLLNQIKPEIVINQLTDLPYALEESKMADALIRNAKLRDEGTRNLVIASISAGVKRLIAQSISFIYADGPTPHLEADSLFPLSHPIYGVTVAGVMSLEKQVTEAPFEGIVLRYGLLYGPGTGFDQPIAPGSVHIDAAAKAAQMAVTKGEPGIYNVAESDGPVNCDKAKKILGWDSSWRLN